jgi:alkylation response protein AidB-like acyl-CoA dehydrogenase
VTAGLPSLLGPAARLEHPLLGKWWRDASGFEFMEGTTAIQRLAVAQGYLTGRFGAGPAAF